jgi:histidinol phosphatase-like enzyme
MLLQVSRHFQTPLKEVYYIGDKYSDMQAARRAGCRPAMVATGYGQRHYQRYYSELNKLFLYKNLYDFVANEIITETNP